MVLHILHRLQRKKIIISWLRGSRFKNKVDKITSESEFIADWRPSETTGRNRIQRLLSTALNLWGLNQRYLSSAVSAVGLQLPFVLLFQPNSLPGCIPMCAKQCGVVPEQASSTLQFHSCNFLPSFPSSFPSSFLPLSLIYVNMSVVNTCNILNSNTTANIHSRIYRLYLHRMKNTIPSMWQMEKNFHNHWQNQPGIKRASMGGLG